MQLLPPTTPQNETKTCQDGRHSAAVSATQRQFVKWTFLSCSELVLKSWSRQLLTCRWHTRMFVPQNAAGKTRTAHNSLYGVCHVHCLRTHNWKTSLASTTLGTKLHYVRYRFCRLQYSVKLPSQRIAYRCKKSASSEIVTNLVKSYCI